MKLASLFAIAATFCPLLFGWGQYGHEQITHAAVKLIEDTPLGKCLSKNIDFMTRLAITPDAEWKIGPTDLKRLKELNQKGQLDPTEEHEKNVLQFRARKVDPVEHENHFFQIDSFAFSPDGKLNPEQIAKIPKNVDFSKDLSEFRDLLWPNIARINALQTDPAKIIKATSADKLTDANIASQGTAPFRVYQLGEIARKNMISGTPDFEKGLLFLGTEAHYKGDMFQPFHTTNIYNTPAGIHSDYEEKILEQFATDQHKNHNPATKLWDYSATEPGILEKAKKLLQSNHTPLTNDHVIGEIYEAAASGQRYLAPLQKAYAANMPADHRAEGDDPKHAGGLHVDDLRKFSSTKITIPLVDETFSGTVLDSALKRMAEASALLAREWMSFNNEYEKARAKDSKLPDLATCPKLGFDADYATLNYDPPTYIPGVSRVSDTPHAPGDNGTAAPTHGGPKE